jgi:TOMM system kinase/cyclase fusion protein
MTFDEVLVQIQELLQREQRVSYRGLKRRFGLDDEYLEDLKEELIGAKRLAVDEDGRFLVWAGKDSLASSGQSLESKRQTPTVQTLAARRQTRDVAAERRQLTVMFCDLVDSTALSAQLDPEELREVIRAYQETCTAVVRRYDGHIAQHLGDGLLVYFGYPVAHEDDAQRAVRAGLEIITAIQKKVPSPSVGKGAIGLPRPLQVRIGVHTGLVVIGEIGSSEKREILALGETPNIAARIQGTAAPDEVMISAATYRLVEGLFTCEERGRPGLKGVATPLTLYRVSKESSAHSRFEVVVRKGLTPLIGREHEFGLLRERWERVKDGTGQAVLLSGEPGIGKSRLVEALKETVERDGARCLELRCSPYAQNSALAPVIEHLQRVLQFQPDDTPEERLQKLSVGATGRSPLPTEAIPLLATFLSLSYPRDFPALTLSPQKQKEKTQETLVSWLCTEAKQQAVIYAWEDLHWADPSTLELLTLFLAQVPTARLLAVLTFRPEFTPPWGAHSYFSQLTLSRLGRAHVETMVEKVTGGEALPKEIIHQIVSKTDGVPLFVEELTKSVVESVGVQHATSTFSLGIPATLQDALMARLDRLGPAKEIAQLGATIGREFTYELLHAVSSLNEDTLQQSLRQLVETELVFQSGVPPQATYLFKHALVQDTAYQSLLKSRRQQLHQQVAQVLVEQFPQMVEMQPELIAYHYTEAGFAAQAIPYWQQAGQKASQRSANVEAINHLMKGLELLTTLPDTPERAQQELTLQIALAVPLVAIKGQSAPEVARAYTRARELCRRIGETPQLFPVLWGLFRFYFARLELQTAQELAAQLLRLAQNVEDPALLMEAHRGLGSSSLALGDFPLARLHLEQGLALYTPEQHHSHAFLYGQDPGVVCLMHRAWSLWFLGYADQAVRSMEQALTLARQLAHLPSLACVFFFAAILHQHHREESATREPLEACLRIASEQGFAQWLAWGAILRGWRLAEQGQRKEGVAQIRQGLAASRATGAEIGRPYYLALLAEVCGKEGQTEEALMLLAEALEVAHRTAERLHEAELYRLKGTLTLQSKVQGPKSKVQEAEACFLKAIDIARKQQAKSLELRAATSLARLWQQLGKQHEAHQMLSDVYNWFTEGFDTKDLQEAKALLDALV